MQAINIHRTTAPRATLATPMPKGWWLAPALVVSAGLWVGILSLIF